MKYAQILREERKKVLEVPDITRNRDKLRITMNKKKRETNSTMSADRIMAKEIKTQKHKKTE